MGNKAHSSTVAVVLIALILGACGSGISTDDFTGVVVEPPQAKPSFVLTDTSGEPYDFEERTEGKVALLYFGYINCPDICPVHLAQIAEVFDQIPAVAHDTEVVFVSVDPARDTPEKMREYLDNFDTRFIGLTGTLEEVEAVQAAADLPAAQIVGDGDDYTINHAGWVIAFAPNGLNYSIYPFGTRQSQWTNDLPLLVEFQGLEGE